MAICSRKRMIVATGSLGPKAEISLRVMVGCFTSLKPEGTVNKILMGYFPCTLLCRQYSQAASVKISITKAFRNTLMKKNMRAGSTSSCKRSAAWCRKTYRDVGTAVQASGRCSEWHTVRLNRSVPRRRQASCQAVP
jgi:hypothetical protein